MLEIDCAIPCSLPGTIEVDPYVPLSFRTYADVLAGPKYYRLGNFQTSLLEIVVDPDSSLVRGLCLVSCDHLAPANKPIELHATRVEWGLPMVRSGFLRENRRDFRRELNVALTKDIFVIDWGCDDVADLSIRHDRISFYIVDSKLCRIAFSHLTKEEVATLKRYLYEHNMDITQAQFTIRDANTSVRSK